MKKFRPRVDLIRTFLITAVLSCLPGSMGHADFRWQFTPARAAEQPVIMVPGYMEYPRKDWDAFRQMRENPISKEEQLQEAVLVNELFSDDWILVAAQQQVDWYDVSKLEVGNFDEDPQSEIYFGHFEEDKIVELDGSVRNFSLRLAGDGFFDLTYDFDQDGRKDFIVVNDEPRDAEAEADSYNLNVYNFRDELIGNINLSHGQFFQQIVADFDGDGMDDYNAVLIRSKNYPARSVPSDSLLIELPEIEGWHYIDNCTGDIDGDGMDELLVTRIQLDGDGSNQSLWAYGVGQEPTLLQPTSGDLLSTPYYCCDLNNDGTDELFMSEFCTDIVNQTVVRMEWPYSVNFPFMHGDDLAQFDIDGTRYLAASPQLIAGSTYSLAIWADGGSLVYYRQFGEEIQSMSKVSYEGRDRLLVLTGSRLMMSP